MENLTKKQKIRRIAETAIMLALSTVLAEYALIKFPFGGSVTLFSQVPMVVIAYRYGTKWGIFSGIATGVVQMLFGIANFSHVSGIVAYLILALADYIVAFGGLGLGGIFKKKIKNPILAIALGGALVSIIRFMCHFISGVTIWGDYSDGAQAVWEYSLTYNAGYMVPELVITVLGCAALGSIFDLESSEIKVRKRNK